MGDGKGSPLSDFYQFLEEEEKSINQLLSHSTDATASVIAGSNIGDIEDLLLQMEVEASDVNSYINATASRVEENLIAAFDADAEDTSNIIPMSDNISEIPQSNNDTLVIIQEKEVTSISNDTERAPPIPTIVQPSTVSDEPYNVSDIDTWTKIISVAKLYSASNNNAITYDSTASADTHISGTYYNNNKGIKILPVDKAYYINNRKILFQQKNLYGVEMYIRPDVTEDQILLLSEQVLLSSSGGVVRCVDKELGVLPPQLKKEVSLMRVVEVSKTSEASAAYSEVTICIGVNQAKHRVLLALIHSDSTVSTEQVKLPQYITELFTALEDEELSISYYFINHVNPTTITSIIDPFFIRDLIAASALDMIMTLTSLVEVLDVQVSTIEKQCARMMTLLKPPYQRANIALPTANSPKSINEYPLELLQTSVLDANSIDIANLFILRARKELKQLPQPPASSMDVVNSLITIIVRYIRDWCNEEALIRLNRKRVAVKERITYIENFKKNLLCLLDSRSVPIANASHNDTKFLTSLYEKCRVFELPSGSGPANPCLFDVNDVTYNNRKGQLYISAAYVYFHSPGGLFVGEEMKLIPVYIVANIVIIMHGSVCVIPKSCDVYGNKADDKVNSKLITTAINSMPVPLISSGAGGTNNVGNTVTTDNSSVLCLELQGSVYEYFYINGPTPDYAHRLGDAINVLITSKLHEKSHVKSTKNSKDATVNDLLDFNYGGDTPSATPVVAGNTSKIAPAVVTSTADTAVSAVASNVTSQQPTVTTTNTGPAPERKKLGNNIKAFLEQKQVLGCTWPTGPSLSPETNPNALMLGNDIPTFMFIDRLFSGKTLVIFDLHCIRNVGATAYQKATSDAKNASESVLREILPKLLKLVPNYLCIAPQPYEFLKKNCAIKMLNETIFDASETSWMAEALKRGKKGSLSIDNIIVSVYHCQCMILSIDKLPFLPLFNASAIHDVSLASNIVSFNIFIAQFFYPVRDPRVKPEKIWLGGPIFRMVSN